MEVVRAPNLSEFKEHLDDTYLCGLVLGSPVRNERFGLMILMGPFQLVIFCDPGGNKEDIGVFRSSKLKWSSVLLPKLWGIHRNLGIARC